MSRRVPLVISKALTSDMCVAAAPVLRFAPVRILPCSGITAGSWSLRWLSTAAAMRPVSMSVRSIRSQVKAIAKKRVMRLLARVGNSLENCVEI